MSDPYFNNVTLLLPFDNLAVVKGGLIDVSNARHQLSTRGGVFVTSAAKKYGSGALDTYNSNGSVEVSGPGDFVFGTADFTVEAWVYPIVAGFWRTVVGQWGNAFDSGWAMTVHSGNGLAFLFKQGTTDYYLGTAAGSVPAGAWHHLAISRNSGTLRLFVNGVQGNSRSDMEGVSVGTGRNIRIGESYSPTDYGNSYIDDVRITHGVGRYTENFTPAQCEYPELVLSKSLLDPDTALSAHPLPQPVFKRQAALTGVNDLYFGGNGKITGTTKNTPALPVARRVRLHESRSGIAVREAWSDATGAYSFTHISRDYTYYVVGFDHTNTYQGVVADKLVPEVM